jgi:hypothetical protein
MNINVANYVFGTYSIKKRIVFENSDETWTRGKWIERQLAKRYILWCPIQVSICEPAITAGKVCVCPQTFEANVDKLVEVTPRHPPIPVPSGYMHIIMPSFYSYAIHSFFI